MKTAKMAEVFVFSNFTRVPVDEVVAGDICAVTGLADVSIGDTICNTDNLIPLPAISVSPHNPSNSPWPPWPQVLHKMQA